MNLYYVDLKKNRSLLYYNKIIVNLSETKKQNYLIYFIILSRQVSLTSNDCVFKYLINVSNDETDYFQVR